MEDTDIPLHSGIPLGHKFFAILLGGAVAAAGCAWLIDQSRMSASTAVLAFNPALAQSVDPGIASAKNPAVVLADTLLNDSTVANLAKQVHLASSTPTGQIGEFRSGLLLAQPSAQRLDVRFQAADASQSMADANAVAQALAAWSPAAGAPLAQSQPAAPLASSIQNAAPASQGQSQPPAAVAAAAQPAQPGHPLSDALNKLGAQLSATDERLERLAVDGDSHSESRQQSLLRVETGEARRTLRGIRAQYVQELAHPQIGARLDEIQDALDSIVSGGHRDGFAAAGVSRRQLSDERSELRQAIHIVNEEAKRIQVAEDAFPAAHAQPSAPATPPSPQTTAAVSSPAPASPSPAVPQSSSGIQEQNLPSTSPNGQAQPQSSQSPLSIVHLAASAPRPPLWPAIAAGAVCCLLYLGIAAFAYRRTGSEYLDSPTSIVPQRMITSPEPVRFNEPVVVPPEPPRAEAETRHRAAFDFRPAPSEKASDPVEPPAAPAEKSPAPVMNSTAPAENVAAPAVAQIPAAPVEALAPPTVDTTSTSPVAESAAAPAETAPAPAGASEKVDAVPLETGKQPAAESQPPAPSPDPVADRIRKGLAETSIGRSLGTVDPPDPDDPGPSRRERKVNRDWLDDWLSPSGK